MNKKAWDELMQIHLGLSISYLGKDMRRMRQEIDRLADLLNKGYPNDCNRNPARSNSTIEMHPVWQKDEDNCS